MSRRDRALQLAALLAVLAPLVAHAQDPTPAPTAPAAVSPAPDAVPLPEIAKRSDDTAVYLKQLEDRLAPGRDVQEIERELPVQRERIDGLRRRVKDVIAASPPIGAVDELLGTCQGVHDLLTGRAAALTASATVLEQEIQGLNDLRGVWRVTKDAAQAAAAPASVLERIKSTSSAILQTRKRIEAHRETLLTLQDQVVQQAARVRETMDELETYRRSVVGRLLVPDAPPIWEPARWQGTWGDSLELLYGQWVEAWRLLREYAALQLVRLPLQLALFAALLMLWRRAHERTGRWLAEDATLGPIAVVFEHPVSSALFLTLISTQWIYPQAPLLLRYLVRIAAVPPLMRVLDRLVDRPLLPGLYALGAFFVVDQVRYILGGVQVLEQSLFMLEMLTGALILTWLLRSRRLHRFEPALNPRTVANLERGAWVLLALFALAFLAAALGFMQLARVAAAAVLGSAYTAMLTFALGRFAAGVWAFLLRTRTLRRLRAVELHRALLQQRGERFIIWVATVLWIVAALDSAGLLRPLRKSLGKALSATLSIGSFSIAPRDVLAFAFTVWLSFAISRFARFVLEEEVFPRVRLARGLPYAFSNILHYTILLVGFLIALAASGLNLDRFALLAGAFGVGIGFGLQNVVNNFVSGLILLFERPVQVGDTVQIGSISGEVRRIGIRSSTLRTGDGAEVIVPNGNFIADTVTNWTLSDRLRRIDIPLTIPFGCDPERVLELLRGVATSHQLVLKHPPPVALFTTVGDRFGFELRCWTDRFEQWSFIRSELSVAIVKVLAEADIDITSPANRDVKLVSGPVSVRVMRGTEPK